MKLLEAIDVVTVNDVETLEDIVECLKDRLLTVELQEPFGTSDYFYEKWEEKKDELEDIVDRFEELYEAVKEGDNDYKEELEKLKRDTAFYQMFYGGLKRLKIQVKDKVMKKYESCFLQWNCI